MLNEHTVKRVEGGIGKQKQKLVIIRRELSEIFEEDRRTGQLVLKPWRPWDTKYHGRTLYSGDIGEDLYDEYNRIERMGAEVEEIQFVIKEETHWEPVENLAKVARDGIKNLAYYCLNKKYLAKKFGFLIGGTILVALPYFLNFAGRVPIFYDIFAVLSLIAICLAFGLAYRKGKHMGKVFSKLSLLPITVWYQSMIPEYQRLQKEREVLAKIKLKEKTKTQ